MFLKLIRINIITLIFFFIWIGYSFSAPTLNIPTNMTVSDGNKAIIPINITGASDAGIIGYSIRLDYDDAYLSNPVIITDSTFSSGKDVKGGPPQDGKGGNYLITLFSGLSVSEDGVVVKLQFDVDSNFSSTNISFVTEATKLFDATYRLVSYSSADGVLILIESGYENDVISVGKNDNDEYTTSEDGFLKMEADAFNGNGFVIAGNNAGEMTFTTNAPGGYQMLSRTWLFEVHDNKPETVTLTFSIPDMPVSVQYFTLLKASDNSSPSNYQELERATLVTEDTLEFQLSSEDILVDHYYTVGFKEKDQDMTAVSVPTLNEWGFICFAGLLILMSIARIQDIKIRS